MPSELEYHRNNADRRLKRLLDQRDAAMRASEAITRRQEACVSGGWGEACRTADAAIDRLIRMATVHPHIEEQDTPDHNDAECIETVRQAREDADGDN